MTDLISRFHELLAYDSETGNLVWQVTRGAATAGSIGGSLNDRGYRQIMIDGKHYFAHRVIWMMHHGPIPDGMQIDHIGGDPRDNHLENLRLATHGQNLANQGRQRRKTLPKGVSRTNRCLSKPYKAQINLNGRQYFLGHYACPTAAQLAYAAAARSLYGEFARAS